MMSDDDRVTMGLPEDDERVTMGLPEDDERVTMGLPEDDERVTMGLPEDDERVTMGLPEDDERVTMGLPEDDERVTMGLPEDDERVTMGLPDDDGGSTGMPGDNINKESAMTSDKSSENLRRRNDSKRELDRQKRKDNENEDIPSVLKGVRETYKVIKKLSTGGQADVFQVSGVSTNSIYIAKIYKKGHENKYQKEIVALLNSSKVPGLIKILDLGIYDSRTFFVTNEYISVEQYKEQIEFNEQRIHRFVKVLNEAVHVLHNAGFIHSDIKPTNIMYDPKNDIPVLIDFGSVTRGVVTEGILNSITKGEDKISEGYAPPELYLPAATLRKYIEVNGKKVLNEEKKKITTSSASDYYQLGICFCEIFTQAKNYGNLFRLFPSNNVAGIQLVNHKVPLPADIANNKRLYCLVMSLVQYDPADRSGYEELNGWLAGKYLKVKGKYNLVHYFDKHEYSYPEELAEAMAGNWVEAGRDVLRGQLEKDFEECQDKKRFIEIQNIRVAYGISERTPEDLETLVFKSVCIVDPNVDFFWDNKLYPSQNGNNIQLSKDLVESVEKKDGKFDSLFKKGLLKFYYEGKGLYEDESQLTSEQVAQRKTIDKIIAVGEISPEVAMVLFADMQTRGVLSAKITGGKKSVEEYLSEIYSEFENGGLDRIIEYYLGDDTEKTRLCSILERLSDDIYFKAFLIEKNMGVVEYKKEELHTEALFTHVINVFGIIGNVIGKNNLASIIKKSASFLTLNAIANNCEDYEFIDNVGVEAESIKIDWEKVKVHNEAIVGRITDGNDIEKLLPLGDAMIASYRIMQRVFLDSTAKIPLVYEASVINSGLSICYDQYIAPISEEGDLFFVNRKYVLTKRVVDSLIKHNYKITYEKLPIRDSVVNDNIEANIDLIRIFISEFNRATEVKNDNITSMKDRVSVFVFAFLMVLNIILILFSLFPLISLIVRSIGDLMQGVKIYRGLLIALLLMGIIKAIVVVVRNIKIAWWDIQTYFRNYKLMTTSDMLVDSLDEIETLKMRNNKIILSQNTKRIIKSASESNNIEDNVNTFIHKRGIKYCAGEFYLPSGWKVLRSNILLLLVCIYCMMPASTLYEKVNTFDYTGALSVSQNATSSGMNAALSRKFLQLYEEDCMNDLISRYNSENYSNADEAYYEYKNLNSIYGRELDENLTNKIDGLRESKLVAETINLLQSNDVTTQKAQLLLQIVPEDSNYENAQKILDSYLLPINEKLQKGIENGDERVVDSIREQYRILINGNDNSKSETGIILEILDNYSGDIRNVMLVKHQLDNYIKNKSKIKNKELYMVGCTKINDGLYMIMLRYKNRGINKLFRTYDYRTLFVNTYSAFSRYEEGSENEERNDIIKGFDVRYFDTANNKMIILDENVTESDYIDLFMKANMY